MIKVSVIIPVYNVEKYLDECLKSIINQSLKDIEIICINDGSTDNSLAILEAYEKRDSRIRIISQENAGLSCARNKGLSLSNGKYIYFMDSDDILEESALEELYELSEKENLDLTIFKMINFDDDSRKEYSSPYYEMYFLRHVSNRVFNYEDVNSSLLEISVTMGGKFFKHDLIRGMEFPEGLIFEDNPFFIKAFLNSDRVYFYDKHLYKKRYRQESITKTFTLKFADVIPISNMVWDISKNSRFHDELQLPILNRKLHKTFIRFIMVDDIYKEEFFIRIKEDFQSNKSEYGMLLDKLDEVNSFIFESALNCNNYKEFESNVEIYRLQHEKNLLKQHVDELEAYKTARIDIKNFGGMKNNIEVIENSDLNSKVMVQEWINDDNGSGRIIESSKGEIDLKIKIVSDGKLKIYIRGKDFKENGRRKKIPIDYTYVSVDGYEYVNGHKMVWHDNPFTIYKAVKDSEVIQITVKWMKLNDFEGFANEIKDLNMKYVNVKKENYKILYKSNEISRKNKKLEKELKKIYSSNSWKITKPLRSIRNSLRK